MFTLRLFVLLCLVLLVPNLRADEQVDAANHAYASGDYDAAAHLFEQIIATRGFSAALCFDLANAEVRAGHTGAAMLNYERARFLAPGDKEIDHNLQLARRQAGLEPNSYRWWEIVLRSIDWTVWLYIMAACLVVISLAIAVSSYRKQLVKLTRLRETTVRLSCRAALFIGIPVFLFLGFVEVSTIGFNNRIEAVVVAPKQATMLLSPIEGSDVHGTISEGELVSVEAKHDDYYCIAGRDKRFGWVHLKDIEPVVAGSLDEQAAQK